jgi:hypothetical protein
MTLRCWSNIVACVLRQSLPVLAAIALSVGATTVTVGEEPDEKWLTLFGGRLLSDWQEDHAGWSTARDVKLDPENDEHLKTVPGDGILVSDGDAVILYTRVEAQDVELKCEFLIPKGSNSGVKLNGLYEIQIRDTHDMKELTGDMCGGVYPRAKQGPPRYKHIDEGIAPSENAAKPAGEWQTLQLTFYSPRFDAAGNKTVDARFEHVVLNGKEIHKLVELHHPTGAAWNMMPEVPRGPLMLQGDHGPVAFRDIQIRPLSK